jgi:5-formaminoimidazole-4-carboxamide-1-(beta)-D-ribofuranosyl 5'-monophosphate synthetase
MAHKQKSRNPQDYTIATVGSHTALQILKGARDEGFKTICITPPGRRKMYASFGLADEIIKIKDWKNFNKIAQELNDKNAILIPHGSLVEYLGFAAMEKLDCMHYGTRSIIKWESDRNKERQWLEGAGIKMPKVFTDPAKINCPVIVKFHGAAGGHGYFIAKSPGEFAQKIEDYPGEKEYAIQEYIVGVPIYVHYFYSPLTKQLEIMSLDKRYESNADSIGRITARDQVDSDLHVSYTIVGNIPLVLRESLLPQVWEMGMNVVKRSQKLEPPKGLFGPFCLEMIIDQNLEFYVFEISARIVAGSNPYVNGSPYTWLRYNEPMSTGRRIARDIKQAIELGKLGQVLN